MTDGLKSILPRDPDGQPIPPRRPPMTADQRRAAGLTDAPSSVPLPPPRYLYDAETLETLAKPYAADALNTLIDVMHDKTNSPAAARVSAANAVLDRGFGKAHQTMDLNTDLSKTTDIALLDAQARALQAKLGAIDGVVLSKTETPMEGGDE